MTQPLTLSKAVDQYLEWRSATLAHSTLVSYRCSLRILIQDQPDLPITELSVSHIERMLAGRRQPHRTRHGQLIPPVGPTGYNNYLGQLRLFCKWLQRRGYTSTELTAEFERMRVWRPVRRQLTPEQVVALFGAVRSPRDRALFALGFFAALRASEIVRLHVRDVDLHSRTLFVHVWKSNLEDEFPIGPELAAELETWLAVYDRSLKISHRRGVEPDDFLIPRWQGHRFARGWSVVNNVTVRNSNNHYLNPEHPVHEPFQVVKNALERIGLPTDGEGMHTLRRSAARIMFDRLIEETKYESALRIVMATLHHTTSEVTERYIGITTEKRSRDEFLRTTPLLNGLRATADISTA